MTAVLHLIADLIAHARAEEVDAARPFRATTTLAVLGRAKRVPGWPISWRHLPLDNVQQWAKFS
jgi:hypothetical protein